MPPTRRTQLRNFTPTIASPYLTQQVWDMKKALQHDDDCPVCLDPVLTCRHCFCLLVCGHVLHTSCFLQLREDSCPVCRAAD